MMAYPDVGQIKMQQLKALERIHGKLGKDFNPFDFAHMSRKDLKFVFHQLQEELSKKSKSAKRAGLVENVC